MVPALAATLLTTLAGVLDFLGQGFLGGVLPFLTCFLTGEGVLEHEGVILEWGFLERGQDFFGLTERLQDSLDLIEMLQDSLDSTETDSFDLIEMLQDSTDGLETEQLPAFL